MGNEHSHPNMEMLRAIYADLRCIDRYVDEDVVLHTAERGMPGQPRLVVGRAAVLAKELELIRMCRNTLVMDVHHVAANDYFGAVLGVLRAGREGRETEMPFCGLWRFRNGRVIEHWENAYDPSALSQFLRLHAQSGRE